MKKKSKSILIGSGIFLAAAAVITGAVVAGVVISNQKRKDVENDKLNNNTSADNSTSGNTNINTDNSTNGNNNNTDGDKKPSDDSGVNPENKEPEVKDPIFEPTLNLVEAGFDSLKINVANLKASDFAGKMIKLVLVNKTIPANQTLEQTYKIQKDNVEFRFNDLVDGTKYNATLYFEEKEIISKDFETKLKINISNSSTSSTTSTNAVLNLSALNKLPQDELKTVEVVIKNKTDSSKPPVVIKVTDLEVIAGNAQLNLEKLSASLEPGQEYSVTVEQKNSDGSKEIISTPLDIATPQPTNVAFSYNSKNKPKEIVLYGLKQNDKKVVLEYRPFGTQINYTSVTSTQNVSKSQVVVNFTQDLGFDNHYEFRVKYVDGSEYLNFENGTNVADFKTEPAPKINVESSEGLLIKLDSANQNIDDSKLFVRYKEKDSNVWVEKPISEVKDPTTGKINLPNLNPDTEYETQLIYKTSNDENTTPTILSVVDFVTQKDLEFAINQSMVSTKKVVLKFNDNVFDAKDVGEDNNYKNFKLTYLKLGENTTHNVNLSKQELNGKVYAVAEIANLDKNTKYAWMFVYNDSEVLFSGEFKTDNETDTEKPSTSLNVNETKETENIAVEDTLVNGVLVLVKNNFGYIKEDGLSVYHPQKITIKYYPKDDPQRFETKEINVSLLDLNEKNVFSTTIDGLNNETYTFEVSYNHGYDANNQLIKVLKTFDVNYKSPFIEFQNDSKQLFITNLESFNDKNITISYRRNSGGNAVNLTKQVVNGVADFQLSELKPNTLYDLVLIIGNDEINFQSSIQGQTRTNFYSFDPSNANSVRVTSSFTTGDQEPTILVVGEDGSTINRRIDVNFAIDGFVNYANQSLKIRVVKGSDFEKYTTNNNDSSVYKQDGDIRVNAAGSGTATRWFKSLELQTHYKVILYKNESSTIKVIKEIDYTTPNLKNSYVQDIQVVNSNTNDPKIRFENIKDLWSTQPNDWGVQVGFRKIDNDHHFMKFSSPILEDSFNFNNEFSFNFLRYFDDDFFKTDKSDAPSRLFSISEILKWNPNKEAEFRTNIQDKAKYQIVLYFSKNNKKYIIASNSENSLIKFNFHSPQFVEDETTNTIVKKENENNQYVASITYKLNSLDEYSTPTTNAPAQPANGDQGSTNTVSTASTNTPSESTTSQTTPTTKNKLRAFYIKSNDIFASLDPINWKLMGEVSVDDATKTGSITFSDLELNTLYNFAFLDNENDIILSKERVRTISKPKLRNTTFGDTIMRYTLSNIKGAQEIFKNDTYKIKFSRDKSYDQESNPFVVDDSTNLKNIDVNHVFTLSGLIPNTTYNYKLVNSKNEVILGYEDFFRTNESQSADKYVGTNYALINLKNPSYTLREGSYSIAKKDENDKLSLDILRLQYSTTENFSDETTKEFSVSLSENEAKLLPIKIDNLKPNTKYFYRLLKGTIKSDPLQPHADSSTTNAPVVSLESNSTVLSGSFTTLKYLNEGDVNNNSAKLVFEKPQKVTKDEELFLRYKRQDNSKEYSVEYKYTIEGDKVIFNLTNLDSNSYYEYLLSGNDYLEYARGEFATKSNNNLTAKMIKVSETLRRIELDNASEYENQKLRISYKKQGDASFVTTDVVITPENNKFYWDIGNLEENKSYTYNIKLLNNLNQPVFNVIEDNFSVGAKFNPGSQTVTTTVRTFGNYDLNNWYTITNLQEIYATNLDWKQKAKEALSEIAIFGSNVVSNSAYAWHSLDTEGVKKEYVSEQNDELVYKYLFNDNGKIKGVEFKLRLFGNQIQVMVIGAKTKPEPVERTLLVDKVDYSELTQDILYKPTAGLINQAKTTIVGDFINISGFRFKAKREKASPKDFSIPQIFRYTMQAASPALNDKTPSSNDNQAGSFFDLKTREQLTKYGSFSEENKKNANVLYNAYIAKNNQLLPFNGNFLVSTSMYPGFAKSENKNTVPGLDNSSKNLRSDFFKILIENGKIKFSGSDTKNKNWISFNSNNILLFEDEEYAMSEKYLTEITVKRLIWRDGNQIKGLRIALNDAQTGNGAVFGQYDDFVYFKEISANENLNSIRWKDFVETASKRTIHNYMNPDSPGSAIDGISFVSRDRMFIDDSYTTFKNFDTDKTRRKFIYESNSLESGVQTNVKFVNFELGTYKLIVNYLTTVDSLESDTNKHEEDIQIAETDKGTKTINITNWTSKNGRYEIIVKKGEEQIERIEKDNYSSQSIDHAVSKKFSFAIGSPNNGASTSGRGRWFSSAYLGLNLINHLEMQRGHLNDWENLLKQRLKGGLIASTYLNDDINANKVVQKWGKAVLNIDNFSDEGEPTFIFAAVSNDKSRVVFAELFFNAVLNGRINETLLTALLETRYYELTEEEKNNINTLMTDEWIKQKFNASSANTLTKVREIGNSADAKRTALIALYVENPVTPPATSDQSTTQPNSNGGSTSGNQAGTSSSGSSPSGSTPSAGSTSEGGQAS